MPGTYTFRPIEANLTQNTELIGKMNPYCAFLVGNKVIPSQVCKKGGKHPHWNDAVTIPMNNNQSKLLVEVLDKDKITKDDNIGNFMVDLQEVQAKGQVSRWYPLIHKNKPAGEILMESVFQPDASSTMGQTFQGEQQIGMTQQQPAVLEQGMIGTQSNNLIREEGAAVMNKHHHDHEGRMFIEQRQVVEPHTFTKAVDVVETRPVMKEIEVMEPVKVLKDVQYTEAVPVKKEIEVVEPQVVKKEVEVIEPRLVTKQIQVVENVPVMKEVEVIEPKTIIKEVETMEPQTFTKQVEVTEQVPVRKQVQTTEPVTITKAVDFVEPVITTQTVTKEIQQPIVVDEKVTTTVGPATVVGIETEVREHAFVDRVNDVRLSEQERHLGKHVEGYSSTGFESNREMGVGKSHTGTYKREHKKF